MARGRVRIGLWGATRFRAFGFLWGLGFRRSLET